MWRGTVTLRRMGVSRCDVFQPCLWWQHQVRQYIIFSCKRVALMPKCKQTMSTKRSTLKKHEAATYKSFNISMVHRIIAPTSPLGFTATTDLWRGSACWNLHITMQPIRICLMFPVGVAPSTLFFSCITAATESKMNLLTDSVGSLIIRLMAATWHGVCCQWEACQACVCILVSFMKTAALWIFQALSPIGG